MKVRHLEGVDAVATEAPGVVVRPLKRVEGVELKVLDVAAGRSTPFHTHPHAHEMVIVSGRGAVRLEVGEQPFEPGDVVAIHPHEPHAIISWGDQPLRLVCMDCFLD